MKKMPTLYERDTEDRRYVTRTINDQARWVFHGGVELTRKWDGTCVMFDGTEWWTRREIKGARQAPPGFVSLGEDPFTKKVMGWEPAKQSGYYRYLNEAAWKLDGEEKHFEPTTYELMGPKVNGNPDGFEEHVLIRHGWAPFGERIELKVLREELERLSDIAHWYDRLRAFVQERKWEGIVFHGPDGRMAKVKKKDFR